MPLVDKLEQIDAADWLVLELSSFQLELFDDAVGGRSLSPQVAAILNITPNHQAYIHEHNLYRRDWEGE